MMLKTKRIGALLVLLLLAGVGNVAALDVPTLKGHVNDYAGMLSAASQRQLETVLTDFEQQESTQITLLTVPSLEGDALEDFSIRVAEAWKIGQSGSDNGAILLISKKDRKIRIEVGYGLEGSLTDLKAGRIIRNVIAPRFKMGQFDQGILEGISAMMGTVKGEYEATDTAKKSSGKGQGVPFMVIALFFLLNGLGRANRVMGAVVGGILFPIAGLLFFGLAPLMLLALIPVGLFAGFFLSLFGGPISSSSGRRTHHGGYWGGGGFGGGGFGGGGFGGGGGFSGGGGGFGGGGASGGW